MSETPTSAPRSGTGPRETLYLAGVAPALPADEPVKIHTHLTDSEAQAVVEGRRWFAKQAARAGGKRS